MISKLVSTPKVFRCPTDVDKVVAVDFFTNQSGFPVLQDRALSYFAGTEALPDRPMMHLAGDRNVFGPGGPFGEFGDCGIADIKQATTFLWPSNAYWDNNLHKKTGNMALNDGSVQACAEKKLRWHLMAAGDPNLSNCSLKPKDEKAN